VVLKRIIPEKGIINYYVDAAIGAPYPHAESGLVFLPASAADPTRRDGAGVRTWDTLHIVSSLAMMRA
jgi:hypothetical protein